MLAKRVIPCLDVKDGRVVKGVAFVALRDAGDPVECAARYDEAGADEIALLDITASHEGRSAMLDVVARAADATFTPLTVGGGIRTEDDVKALLDAGADKVSINTSAVKDPDLVRRCAERWGAQAIVVAIDAKRRRAGGEHGWEVFIHGGRTATGLDVVSWATKMADLGAGEILLTSMDRDGTRSGYDLGLTRAVSDAVPIPVIASGGVGTLEDLRAGLVEGGASAVLAASIFHDGVHTVGEAKRFLARAGVAIRDVAPGGGAGVNSTLESSVTLEDVFVVVGARRVPLAPELAGYLALEIAEGATQAAGDIDPRSVYIGEEGSVALVVRPRREQTGGDAEGSIRAILTRLLDASGSQTPALAAAARRSPSAGLNMLVEEVLEAALIPVNRAAGRRALARLAREVKRVTLGVGRNASLAPGEPPPRRGSSPSNAAVREGAARAPQEEPRPLPRSGFSEEPPTTARRDVLPDPMALPSARVPEPAQSSSDAPVTRSTSPDASELPTVEVRKDQIVAALSARSNPPPKVERSADPTPAPRGQPQVDEVDHLLASFGVSSRGEQSQRNELKALVGLEPTPPPPGSEHAHDRSGSESDVESLLAISDAGPPVATSGAPSRTIASPPTAISPALANEPYGGASRPQPSAPLAQPRSPREGGAPTTNPEARATGGARAVPTAPSARRLAEMGSQPNIAPPPDRSLTVFALVVLVAGGIAIWLLRPALFGPHDARPTPSRVTATSASAAPAQAPRCHASLLVTGAPASAEILVRAGQAPVDIERMPVGPRLEFVATAEGYAPKRAIIPAGATWDSGPDGKPRYEVAAQLDHSRARPGGVDPWPAGEPGSDVGGKGSPGTVHLVTTPRGAEVWQLAALGPDAEFDVKCGGEVEVLVAGPTTLRKRLRVSESEFVAVDGGTDRQAHVSLANANVK